MNIHNAPTKAFVIYTPSVGRAASAVVKECEAFGVSTRRCPVSEKDSEKTLKAIQACWRAELLAAHGLAVFVLGRLVAVRDIAPYIELAREMAESGVRVWVAVWNNMDDRDPHQAVEARDSLVEMAKVFGDRLAASVHAHEVGHPVLGQFSVTDFSGDGHLRWCAQNLLALLGCDRTNLACAEGDRWTLSRTFQWPDIHGVIALLADESSRAGFNLERIYGWSNKGLSFIHFVGTFPEGMSFEDAAAVTRRWDMLFRTANTPPSAGPIGSESTPSKSLRTIQVQGVPTQQGRLALIARAIQKRGARFSEIHVEPSREGSSPALLDIQMWIQVAWLPWPVRKRLYEDLKRIPGFEERLCVVVARPRLLPPEERAYLESKRMLKDLSGGHAASGGRPEEKSPGPGPE